MYTDRMPQDNNLSESGFSILLITMGTVRIMERIGQPAVSVNYLNSLDSSGPASDMEILGVRRNPGLGRRVFRESRDLGGR